MADYSNLQDAIDAGIENMTCHRNNSAQDDGTDTVATNITWLYFNGVQVTNIYASGNSWIGFGASSEQLKVNRRDCKMYYLYTETGIIGRNKFYKIRWKGTSYYSSSYQNNEAYQQYFDVFLFDNGQIFLNYYNVPTTTGGGTNALVCGSITVSFSPTAGVPGEWTFTASDIENGTGWTVSEGRPNLIVDHKLSGSAIYEINNISGTIASSSIAWTEEKPEGTNISVSVSTDGESFTEVSNCGNVFPAGTVLSDATIYVKVEMSTTETTVTPTLSNLSIIFQSEDDVYRIILETNPLERFESAAGDITVKYEQAKGNLMGVGGLVDDFELTFTPTDLIAKPDTNSNEHIEISSITAEGNLIRIYYHDTKADEHIEISSITATGTLTHIDDL